MMAPTWLDRLWSSIADRGRAWIKIPAGLPPLEETRQLAFSLLSEKGEASGAALARALLDRYAGLGAADRADFLEFLARNFAPDPAILREAAETYCADPSPGNATKLAEAAEPPRQELLRRMNMGLGGTGALVRMRAEVLRLRAGQPALDPLDSDLLHLLTAWFNRGFLEIRRIDWNTPAAILEKLIAYEAVHEIDGWDDLRRRLADDRRCFAFFHPAMVDEPLIFVEVALLRGMAGAIQPLLARQATGDGQNVPAKAADTAIFYSISNCQRGLRGISFGNFLIKQVVEELKREIPSLKNFATLSPVPGFRTWLDRKLASGAPHLVRAAERAALMAAAGKKGARGALRALLDRSDWPDDPPAAAALRAPLLRLCAQFLTEANGGKGPADSVARFHLGNGARLERIHFLANTAPRGLQESWTVMVNYLYDRDRIEANHEAFVKRGQVAVSDAVTELLRDERPAAVGNLLGLAGLRGAALAER